MKERQQKLDAIDAVVGIDNAWDMIYAMSRGNKSSTRDYRVALNTIRSFITEHFGITDDEVLEYKFRQLNKEGK